MTGYLAALGEIAACRLRILARTIGSKLEAQERDAAVRALDAIAREVHRGPDMSPRLVLDTRRCARQQMSYVAKGAIMEADVLGWANAWMEWSVAVDAGNVRIAKNKGR